MIVNMISSSFMMASKQVIKIIIGGKESSHKKFTVNVNFFLCG